LPFNRMGRSMAGRLSAIRSPSRRPTMPATEGQG
jgi:hypothetical protein